MADIFMSLTSTTSGNIITFNLDHVMYYESLGSSSCITTVGDGKVYVNESPDTINELLQELYVTRKERLKTTD